MAALSFSEKRALQRIVQDKIAALESRLLGFKEKREVQRALEDALARLEGSAAHRRSQKLDDLLAGKFNRLEPMDFLKVLEEVVAEIGGDVEPVKDPTVSYIEAHEGAIMESAMLRSLINE